MEYRLVLSDELYHYGVPGMRWGHRKSPDVATARSQYRSAYKDYNRSFNKAYSFSSRHPISQHIKRSKNYQKSNDLWNDAASKAERANRAKANLNRAKKGEKIAKQQAIKNAKTSYKEAKAKSNAARKAYSKSYNKAYNYSGFHPISQFNKNKKAYNRSNELWRDATTKAGEYNSAHKEMRAARKAYRAAKRR